MSNSDYETLQQWMHRKEKLGDAPLVLHEEIEALLLNMVNMSRKLDFLDKEDQLRAYQKMFIQMADVLHWINQRARQNGNNHIQKELKHARAQVEELQLKLDRLLHKAALLSKENKNLKAKTASGGASHTWAFNLLGLEKDADLSSIKGAYRKKVKNVHPDRAHGDPDLFKSLTTAYLLLKKAKEAEL